MDGGRYGSTMIVLNQAEIPVSQLWKFVSNSKILLQNCRIMDWGIAGIDGALYSFLC